MKIVGSFTDSNGKKGKISSTVQNNKDTMYFKKGESLEVSSITNHGINGTYLEFAGFSLFATIKANDVTIIK